MKQNVRLWTALTLLLCLLCTACGSGENENDDINENNDNSETKASETTLQEDPNEGLGGDVTVLDTSNFAGIYMPNDPESEWNYLEVYDDGTFLLSGINADINGWIGYDSDYDSYYAYEDSDGSGCQFELNADNTVYLAAYGYFSESGMDDIWYDDNPEDIYDDDTIDYHTDYNYSWNEELYQRNVSELEGVWYFDGEYSAESYIVIDGDGNWSYYGRGADDDVYEIDSGFLTYSDDEVSTYYAYSTLYDDLSYRVFEFELDILIWGDEGAFYLLG